MKIKESFNLDNLVNYGFKEFKHFYKRESIIHLKLTGHCHVIVKIYKKDRTIKGVITRGFYHGSRFTEKGIADLIKDKIVESEGM